MQQQKSQLVFGNDVNYWLVGSYWENENPQERLPEFKRDGVWINGHGEDKFTERVNAVSEGDILICKSTFRKNGKSILRFKGVGIVTKKTEYGSVLNVDWKKEFITKDLDDFGFYRDTIHRVRNEDLEVFINVLNESGEEEPTRILFADFEERIKYSGQEVSSYIINITDMGGVIQHAYTEHHFTFKKNADNSFEIETNPDLNIAHIEKGSFLLPLFESWLSLLDKKILKGDSDSRKAKSTKKKELLNTGVIKHTLSIKKSDSSLLSKGYGNQGLIGYIDRKQANGALPLYSSYREDKDEFINIFEPEIDDRNKWVSDEFHLLGYVPTLQSKNRILLRQYLNKTDDNNRLYCTKPNEQYLSEFGLFEQLVNSGKIFLDTVASRTNTTLYTYSTQPELLFFEPLEEVDSKESYDTHAEILADNIAIQDELGRKWLMKILFDRVNGLWPKLRNDESFTVLINGEWGSGKSSMLYYLEEILKRNKWTVVKYNAWENQRFDEPWWILVNKISKEVPREAFDKTKNHKSQSHWIWRNKVQYSISFIAVLIVLILAVVGYKYDLVVRSEIKYYASIIALIGSIWIAINGTIQFLFRKKAFSALHSSTANDPFESVKKRFSKVLEHKRVAIFIDDLDRCEVDATVKLLEGIQTLFKNSKVLYVIAADGAWVSNCFDKKYDEFKGLTREGQTIGNEFLQKTFQLVVDVPKLSRLQQDSLLKKYLNREEKIEQETIEEVSEEDLSKKETLEAISGSTAQKGAKSRFRAAKRAEAIIEEQKQHLVQKLQELNLVPLNPRQMKRLINLFTLKVQVLLIAGTLQEIGEENLLRYVLFSTEYPDFDQKIRNNTSLEELSKKYPEVVNLLGADLTSEMIREYL